MGFLDKLRNIADPGNEWIQEFKEATWTTMDEMRLDERLTNVAYCAESCCFMGNRELGNQVVFFILRSINTIDLRIYYYGVSISTDKDELRVYVKRTETLEGKYNNQKRYDPVFVLPASESDAIVNSFDEIDELSEENQFYLLDECWVSTMFDLPKT
jgi:hypothetical protein